jgi:hypothetical protein
VDTAVDFALKESGGFEDAEVFRDRRERHGKGRGQSLDGGFALGEAREDGAAGGIGEGAESSVQPRGGIVNHTVYYKPLVFHVKLFPSPPALHCLYGGTLPAGALDII